MFTSISQMTISFPFVSNTQTKKEAVSSSSLKQLEQHLIEKPSSALQVSSNKNENRPLPVKCMSRDLERVFRYFDTDGDGKISPAELRSYMTTVGEELSQEDVEAVVQSTDSDGDGLLGFEDFVRLIEVEGEEEKRKDLREAFGMYEMEGSGCITPKSLKRMLGRLGESKSIEECRVMISQFDLDGDGVLNFEEFKVMML